MPVTQYTYFDLCKAVFGASTDAFGVEAIHDFIVNGVKSRKPHCLYYGDFDIEISSSLDSIAESLRREFDKTYIEVNMAYEIIDSVAGVNAALYTSVVDNVLKSGDKHNVLNITITRMGHDYKERFIKADLLPGFVVTEYLKRDRTSTKSSSDVCSDISKVLQNSISCLNPANGIFVAKCTIEQLKQFMKAKYLIEPESVYDECINMYLASIAKKDSEGPINRTYVENGVIVRQAKSSLEGFVKYFDRLSIRLLNKVHEIYMSAESIYKKTQDMPVFCGMFSFVELRNKLEASSAFKHEGMLIHIIVNGKKESMSYLKKSEFDAFLEDEYPELYEKYLLRKNPWLSVEKLTCILNLSEYIIREVLSDMASIDKCRHLIRYENRLGKQVPFLKPDGMESFLECLSIYKERQKREQAQRNMIKTYYLSADQVAERVNMPVDMVCDVLKEMSKDIIYTFTAAVLEENGEKHYYLSSGSTLDFKNYVKYRYKEKSGVDTTKTVEPVVEKPVDEKPVVISEEKTVDVPVTPRVPSVPSAPRKPQTPRKPQPTKKVYNSASGTYEPYYINGSAKIYLPDIRILSQDRYSGSMYMDPGDFDEMIVANAHINDRCYDENGNVKNLSSKHEDMSRIIKTYLKNVKNYYQEKAVQMTEARERVFMRCIMNGVYLLNKESDFIKNNFNIDVRPLMEKYRKGEFPTLTEVYKVFLDTEFNNYCVKQLATLSR